MISVTNFRKNIFIIFQLMTNTKSSVEIYYKDKVYEVYCIETDKPIKRKVFRPDRVSQILPIESTTCQCGAVAFNGICTNTACSGYVKAV